MPTPYTIIIGLEVHVQLLAESKMFCGCSTKFGEPPNTQTCPVCIGMPGSLPVMNRKAFELAMKTAIALNCEIPHFTKWDRKNYYYPDLPKGYQISQFDLPMSNNGWLEIGEREEERGEGRGQSDRSPSLQSPIPNPNPSNALTLPLPGKPAEGTRAAIGILRAPPGRDAGKSTARRDVAGKADSRIDLNRAGTPLLEIVSQPDLRSPEEAKAYLTELKLLLNYLGVSDCNMQEGSLRVDANINLHIDGPHPNPLPKGEGTEIIATPIVEVKNMNSFRAVERALAYEAQRQWQEWQETGHKLGDVPKTTRGWDEVSQTTRPQRSKEESSDYRYFPDPDLVPVTVTDEEVERVRASLGELPAALRKRLEQTYGITPYDADVLVNQGRALVDYYVELAEACGDGKAASNWIQQDVLRWLGEQQVEHRPVSRRRQAAGRADREGPRRRLRDQPRPRGARRHGCRAQIAGRRHRRPGHRRRSMIRRWSSLCRKLVAANPKIAAEVREGKLKGLGALIGQAKKENPNVNASRVREICQELIVTIEFQSSTDVQRVEKGPNE